MGTRRRLGWRLLVILGPLLIVPLLCLAFGHWALEATFDAHRDELPALRSGVQVPLSGRPALLGPEEPGNAWDLLRPAFDAVGGLYDLELLSEYDDLHDANLDSRGIPAGTPQLMEEAEPALEMCRRAMRRTRLEWTGPVDPYLPAKAGRMGRALCTRAAYAFEAGRDAEAVEWLVVALGAAQDAARLGQPGTRSALQVVERWVVQEARAGLLSHGLSFQELQEFERRLDLLRAHRPSFVPFLRFKGAGLRQELLDGEVHVDGPAGSLPVEKTAGWKDLFLERVCRARMLNGVRAGTQELCALQGTSPVVLPAKAAEVLAGYPPENLAQILRCIDFFEEEKAAYFQLDLFRLAVAFAREEAASDRFPQSLDQVGVPVDLGRAVWILDDGFKVAFTEDDPGLTWTVGRRRTD